MTSKQTSSATRPLTATRIYVYLLLAAAVLFLAGFTAAFIYGP